jgi:hypothetical protein
VSESAWKTHPEDNRGGKEPGESKKRALNRLLVIKPPTGQATMRRKPKSMEEGGRIMSW